MSKAHIDKFHRKVGKNIIVIKKMLKGATSHDDFLRNAMNEASGMGYNFSLTEARQWSKNKPALKTIGEMSDTELEAYVGGKHL